MGNKVENFNNYVKTHQNWMEKYDVHKTAGGLFNVNYGRIIIPVEQDNGIDPKVAHTYAAAINLNNGDIYFDCEKEKITFKNGWMGIYRVIRIPFKMLYHVSIILPIVNEIFTWREKPKADRTWGHLAFCTFRCTVLNAADVVLTPISHVALIALHLVGWVLGKCDSDLVYKQREWVYNVELLSVWGDAEADFAAWPLYPISKDIDLLPVILAKCFGPEGGNLADKNANDKKAKKYADEQNPIRLKNNVTKFAAWEKDKKEERPELKILLQTESLKAFAMKQISYRQNYTSPMNDVPKGQCLPGGVLLPIDKPYVSVAMNEVPKKKKKKDPAAATVKAPAAATVKASATAIPPAIPPVKPPKPPKPPKAKTETASGSPTATISAK